MDFQVKWNRDYNPAPGRGIEKVLLEDILVESGDGEESSVISGYSAQFMVRGVTIRNMVRDGKRVQSLEEAHIQVGPFAEGIRLE